MRHCCESHTRASLTVGRFHDQEDADLIKMHLGLLVDEGPSGVLRYDGLGSSHQVHDRVHDGELDRLGARESLGTARDVLHSDLPTATKHDVNLNQCLCVAKFPSLVAVTTPTLCSLHRENDFLESIFTLRYISLL